jgi:hypothetical protein
MLHTIAGTIHLHGNLSHTIGTTQIKHGSKTLKAGVLLLLVGYPELSRIVWIVFDLSQHSHVVINPLGSVCKGNLVLIKQISDMYLKPEQTIGCLLPWLCKHDQPTIKV